MQRCAGHWPGLAHFILCASHFFTQGDFYEQGFLLCIVVSAGFASCANNKMGLASIHEFLSR
jgi:hypothetical protein